MGPLAKRPKKGPGGRFRYIYIYIYTFFGNYPSQMVPKDLKIGVSPGVWRLTSTGQIYGGPLFCDDSNPRTQSKKTLPCTVSSGRVPGRCPMVWSHSAMGLVEGEGSKNGIPKQLNVSVIFCGNISRSDIPSGMIL